MFECKRHSQALLRQASLVTRVHLEKPGGSSRNDMMKITLHDRPGATTIRLEGRIVGPWAGVLDQTWRSLVQSLGSKKLHVDLCNVIQMDTEGKRVLSEIYRASGAHFVADTPMTKYFAYEAQLRGHKDSRKGE